MRLSTIAVLLGVSLLAAVPRQAYAGVYGDELAKCLVEKTTDSDKVLLAQWVFTVISVHPSAASLARVSEADRTNIAKQTGKVIETLLAESCKDQTAKAVKYEGTETLGNSFKVLGGIAMTTLMTDPAVAAQTGSFTKYIDEKKIQGVLRGGSGG